MAVLADKGHAIRDVNMADLKEVLKSIFLGICMARKGS
jgi:hypothetical protein